MLRPKALRADLSGMADGSEREIAGYITEAMEETALDVQEAFREQVRSAGLGDRLANAIRHKTFPRVFGKASVDAAGWVYAQPSKDGRGAAAIIESYASGANIVPGGGKRWLAIPTDDCPRHRQGNAFTPAEVEEKFGRKLQFISPDDKGFRTPSTRHRGVAYLVLKGLVIRKATGRWRNASEREREGRTRNPRPVQAVIMFTLVPSVKKPQSIDLSAPEQVAVARFPANLDNAWRA